jgi:hypothetical protein
MKNPFKREPQAKVTTAICSSCKKVLIGQPGGIHAAGTGRCWGYWMKYEDLPASRIPEIIAEYEASKQRVHQEQIEGITKRVREELAQQEERERRWKEKRAEVNRQYSERLRRERIADPASSGIGLGSQPPRAVGNPQAGSGSGNTPQSNPFAGVTHIGDQSVGRNPLTGQLSHVGGQSVQNDPLTGKPAFIGGQSVQYGPDGKPSMIGDQHVTYDPIDGKIKTIGGKSVQHNPLGPSRYVPASYWGTGKPPGPSRYVPASYWGTGRPR